MSEIKQANGHRYRGVLGREGSPIPSSLRPEPESLDYDLEEACRAVLALASHVPDDAFTAGTLGTEREGNAVLIDDDGLALTIGYLVTEAERIVLVDARNRDIDADPVGYDQVTGFGLVRAREPIDVPPLSLGSIDRLGVGDAAVAIGYGGVSHALSTRVVSRRMFAGYWEYLLDEALFTAPPHPHWSGAALLDSAGRLAGLGSLHVQDAMAEDRSAPGNMFVPLDLLPPILDDLKRLGRASRPPRPWLGMLATEIDERIVVAGLMEGAPADRAGLRVGDFLLGVGDADATTLPQLYRQIWDTGTAGVDVPLRVFRDDRVRTVTVRSADRNDYLKQPARH